jgi:hypothetical protein
VLCRAAPAARPGHDHNAGAGPADARPRQEPDSRGAHETVPEGGPEGGRRGQVRHLLQLHDGTHEATRCVSASGVFRFGLRFLFRCIIRTDFSAAFKEVLALSPGAWELAAIVIAVRSPDAVRCLVQSRKMISWSLSAHLTTKAAAQSLQGNSRLSCATTGKPSRYGFTNLCLLSCFVRNARTGWSDSLGDGQ